MSGELPIFGENGAVLNSETMADEWRAEHEAGLQEPEKIAWAQIAAIGIFLFAIFIVPRGLLPALAIGLGILSLFRVFIPKVRETPLQERLIILVLFIPIMTDWLHLNGHLGNSERWFWAMVSSAFSLSLIVVYYAAKHLMINRRQKL